MEQRPPRSFHWLPPEGAGQPASGGRARADQKLLTIRNLAVDFNGLPAVDRINLDVAPGEVVGVVGESGSGKSVTMMALMGLIDAPGKVSADEVTFDGKDLLKASPKERRKI